MQVGRTTDQNVAAAGGSGPIAAPAASSAPAAASDETTAAAAPLSGGRRTVSLGIFAEADGDAVSSASSLADVVAQKTAEASKALMSALEAAKIPTDEPIKFTLDASGQVSVDSPYKDRIEKLLKDNPDLVKQLKDVAALNSMVALNEAMRRYAEAQKKAENDDERQKAQDAYTADCTAIQSLSGNLTLSDGQLSSAAMGYMQQTA